MAPTDSSAHRLRSFFPVMHRAFLDMCKRVCCSAFASILVGIQWNDAVVCRSNKNNTSRLLRAIQNAMNISRCFRTCLVIVIVTGLVYNTIRYHVTSLVGRINDSALIEQALLTIPTCTPRDRPRQRLLLSTLQVWARFADAHGLRYWLAYGTLVGYVQRGGLLPHDADVDILIMQHDTARLVALSDVSTAFDANTYALRVQPLWRIVDYVNRSYFPSEGIHFVAPNARFIHRKSDCHVDIWAAHDPPSNHSAGVKDHSSHIMDYSSDYDWESFPRNWTFPLRQCEFSGVKSWCPAEPSRLVAAKYGDSAVSQSDTSCVNSTWV